MFAPARHRAILRLLAEKGRLSLDEIAAAFGISPATARRDAGALARTGLAQRTHGGLLPPDFSLAEPAYPRKSERAFGTKARLGAAAARLMPENGTVFIDAGSTCLEVGRALLDRPALRIFTNSVPLLALAGDAQATLVALGGEVRRASLALTGALAQAWLQNVRFDAAVIGASGIEPALGPSTTETSEAGTKIEAMRRARLRVLVAHAEKWGRPAAVRFAPWSAFHHFVTDRSPARADRAALAAAGVRLHFVASK